MKNRTTILITKIFQFPTSSDVISNVKLNSLYNKHFLDSKRSEQYNDLTIMVFFLKKNFKGSKNAPVFTKDISKDRLLALVGTLDEPSF